MRIALFGHFGSGNFGNDGSLEAMLDRLRATAPAAELLCICSSPGTVAARYGISAIGLGADPPRSRTLAALDRVTLGAVRRIGNLLAAFIRCRGIDLVVVPGTGILDDFRDRPFGWPFALLRWCLAARLSGARLAFVSIGAGPIRHPLSRRFMKWAAQLATYRSYRDEQSRDFMRRIGLDVARDPVYPDLAMRLSAPAPVPRENGALTVGVGVMSYHGWSKSARDEEIYERYIDRLGRFVTRLGARGCRVRLLIGDASDAQAVADVSRRVVTARGGADGWLVAAPAASLADVVRQIAQCDVVVATRFHNVVCALCLGRPTISLGYAEKNAALLREFGLGAYCRHVECFDVDELVGDLDRLIADRDAHARLIRAGHCNALRQLAEQDRMLAERFLPGSRHEAPPAAAARGQV